MRILPLLALLVACGPPVFGTGPEIFSEPVAHDGDGWIFSQERINRIDISIGPDQMDILLAERRMSEPRNEVLGALSIDGEQVGDVGLRLRGHLGSFQRVNRKPKWKLDLNEFTGERFHGLEALSLNNGSADASFVGVSLAHEAFRQAGVPASRSGYAQVFVNGDDYGLYLVLETQDDRWLKRLQSEGQIADRKGNYYDGSYIHAGWIPVSVDFGAGRDHHFDLEEGEDVGFADIAAISEEVVVGLDEGRISGDLRDTVDWDRVIRHLLVEQWLGNGDGYALGSNNYRVYFEPGGAMFINPWDVDASFMGRSASHEAWQRPGGRLARLCRLDAACREQWRLTAAEVADDLDAVDWQQRLDDLVELTRVGADLDPRSEALPEDRQAARQRVSDWLDAASDELREAYR